MCNFDFRDLAVSYVVAVLKVTAYIAVAIFMESEDENAEQLNSFDIRCSSMP
jgi:hypothetical protein